MQDQKAAKENAENRIQKMNVLMHHRGPDQRGSFVSQDGLVALGNTRLSIVDAQNLFPVPIRTPNHSAVLTYNGELFNYKELRKDLEVKGEKFQTYSDTEVMLNPEVNYWTPVDQYVGGIQDGKLSGKGTYSFTNGDKYVGGFEAGKKHGQGTLTYPDGEKYVGEYKDGLSNGQGTYTWNNGNKYVGEFKDDKMHGQGAYTWVSGTTYVGEWKNGQYHGHGTITYPYGTKYLGEWKDNKMHGQGTLIYPDGEKYVREGKDGKVQGTAQFWKMCLIGIIGAFFGSFSLSNILLPLFVVIPLFIRNSRLNFTALITILIPPFIWTAISFLLYVFWLSNFYPANLSAFFVGYGFSFLMVLSRIVKGANHPDVRDDLYNSYL